MELRCGIVKAFDANSYKATVQVVGSLSVWLEGLAVSRDIPEVEMVTGRSCAMMFFDETNPNDAVLVAVWE